MTALGLTASSVEADGSIQPSLDEVEYVAVGSFDGRGIPHGQAVTVFGPRRPNPPLQGRGTVALADKLSRGARARLETATAQQAGGNVDLMLGVATDVRFASLPKLRRDVPRSHPDNAAIIEARGRAIADVASARKAQRSSLETRIRDAGGAIVEEFPMGNALRVVVPETLMDALAGDSDVLSLVLSTEATGTSGNVERIRWALNTDVFTTFGYDGSGVPGLYLGLLDTGVRETHNVFTGGGGGTIDLLFDCDQGGPSCNDSSQPDYFTGDDGPHGTSMANIIMAGVTDGNGSGSFPLPPSDIYKGVSGITLDSFNIHPHGPPPTTDEQQVQAMSRAFARAALVGDDIIVQAYFYEGTDPAIIAANNAAANDAYDSGIMILTAIGNNAEMSSPGRASKVFGIGAYDALSSQVEPYFPSGRVNGRIKPDILMPTNATTAVSYTDYDLWEFGGTSGAAAAAGGAAAIMYAVYDALNLGTEAGVLYAAMLAGGDGYSPSDAVGAGRFRHQGVCGTWVGGFRDNVLTANVDITIPVPASRKNLKVALWWPEEENEAHSRVQLRLYSPSGVQVDSSTDSTSVWQIAGAQGSVAAGNWTLRIDPYFTLPRNQQVFFAAQAVCEDVDQFVDAFANLNNWTETGEGDWNTEGLHSLSDYPLSGSGTPAVHSDDCDTECVLTSPVIGLQWLGNATLEFWRFVDSELDAGEYLRVELYDGVQWITVRNWTEGSGDDNTWRKEVIDLTPYTGPHFLTGTNNFRIRFKTKSSLTSEHVHIDDVRVRTGLP